MSTLWAIDPGPIESALVRYDLDEGAPVWWVKRPNREILHILDTARVSDARNQDRLAIEMIASYGMPVGKDVFETCVWIGRFIDRWVAGNFRDDPLRRTRIECKNHLCHSSKASDANVRQALIDRYGPGKELAIGRKATPGPLYGMAGDCWSALAVAVTAAETTPELTSK